MLGEELFDGESDGSAEGSLVRVGELLSDGVSVINVEGLPESDGAPLACHLATEWVALKAKLRGGELEPRTARLTSWDE